MKIREELSHSIKESERFEKRMKQLEQQSSEKMRQSEEQMKLLQQNVKRLELDAEGSISEMSFVNKRMQLKQDSIDKLVTDNEKLMEEGRKEK